MEQLLYRFPIVTNIRVYLKTESHDNVMIVMYIK